MKVKLIFFVIILLFVATKKSYLYVNEVKSLKLIIKRLPISYSLFDSVKAYKIYKNKVIKILNINNLKIKNLKLLISKENKIVKDKLEKQIEIIVFKNNQLNKNISNYRLQSVSNFQFYKTNFNNMLAENNQLTADILDKHKAITNTK